MCILRKKYKLQENINKELLLEIVKIAREENVYISSIQRKLSVGYTIAKEHLEWLVSNKFAKVVENNTYLVTPKQYIKITKAKFE